MSKLVLVKLHDGTFNINRTDTILPDLAKLLNDDHQLVLVHGPTHGNNAEQPDLSSGQLNQKLVAEFNTVIVGKAIGLSGAIQEPDQGELANLNLGPVWQALEEGYTPIVAIPSASPNQTVADKDVDHFAVLLASNLKADTCILLGDTQGILNKTGKTIKVMDSSSAQRLRSDGTINDKDFAKVEAAFTALEGANRVVLLKAERPDMLYETVAQYWYNGTTFLSRVDLKIKLGDLPLLDETWPYHFMPTPKDAELVGKLAYPAYVDTIDGYGDEAQNIAESKAIFEEGWGKYLENSSFTAYELDPQGQPQIVGISQLVKVGQTEVPFVMNLFVVPAYRGKRVGYNLLVRSLKTLQEAGYQEAWISVARGNQPAYRLYTGIGFELTPMPWSWGS